MQIERVEVRLVAPKVPRYTWSHDLPEQYMTNTLVRIYTDAGFEGVAGVSNYTSYDYERYTAETAISPEEILERLRERGRETHFIPAPDEIVFDLVPRLKGGEVVVIMSNGSFGGIHEKLLDALRETEASAFAEG